MARTQSVAATDRQVFNAIGTSYDKSRHGRPDATHAQGLPLDFIERFAVIGSPETCIERLRALVAVGIERFFIIGPRPDHFGEQATIATQRFATDVIPAFRK